MGKIPDHRNGHQKLRQEIGGLFKRAEVPGRKSTNIISDLSVAITGSRKLFSTNDSTPVLNGSTVVLGMVSDAGTKL